MTELFIKASIEMRMAELGFSKWTMDMVRFPISSNKPVPLKLWNRWAFFPTELNPSGIKVVGQFGEFGGIGVQVYEHTDQIEIHNQGPNAFEFVTFIQVEPYE